MDWVAVAAVATLVTAVVTGVYAFLVWQTMKEIKGQRDIMQEQVREAVHARLESVHPALSISRRAVFRSTEISFEVSNIGLGPAFNIEVRFTPYKTKTRLKSLAVGESTEVKMLLGPLGESFARDAQIQLLFQDLWLRYILLTFVVAIVNMPTLSNRIDPAIGQLKEYDLDMDLISRSVTNRRPKDW
jgi:hypothetical protein